MRTDIAEPCAQCPFRKASAPGWLGPWEPKDLLASLAVQEFPCHPTIKEDGQDTDDPTLQGCTGAALFLNNSLEHSRCWLTMAHQIQVRDVPDDVKRSVFQTRKEFLEHHDRATCLPEAPASRHPA